MEEKSTTKPKCIFIEDVENKIKYKKNASNYEEFGMKRIRNIGL